MQRQRNGKRALVAEKGQDGGCALLRLRLFLTQDWLVLGFFFSVILLKLLCPHLPQIPLPINSHVMFENSVQENMEMLLKQCHMPGNSKSQLDKCFSG